MTDTEKTAQAHRLAHELLRCFGAEFTEDQAAQLVALAETLQTWKPVVGDKAREMRAEVAELRTPAAVTPEPAGPRVWCASKQGYLFREDERGRIEAAPAYRPDDWGTTAWKSLKDVEQELGPLTEVPAVPPAEPGAGA